MNFLRINDYVNAAKFYRYTDKSFTVWWLQMAATVRLPYGSSGSIKSKFCYKKRCWLWSYSEKLWSQHNPKTNLEGQKYGDVSERNCFRWTWASVLYANRIELRLEKFWMEISSLVAGGFQIKFESWKCLFSKRGLQF